MVADALSKRHTLLSSLRAQILGFDIIRELYVLMSISLPFMLVVGTRPKMDSTLLRRIFSRREDFVYPKDPL